MIFDKPTVVIMHGISGSGKSSLAKKIIEEEQEVCIVSADYYWIRPDRQYDFNYKLLGHAHDWCHKEFDLAVNDDSGFQYRVVIADNTNLTYKECEYYIQKGIAEGYQVVILEPDTEWALDCEELSKRNTHGVPLEAIKNMINKRQCPTNIIGQAILAGIPSEKISWKRGEFWRKNETN